MDNRPLPKRTLDNLATALSYIARKPRTLETAMAETAFKDTIEHLEGRGYDTHGLIDAYERIKKDRRC